MLVETASRHTPDQIWQATGANNTCDLSQWPGCCNENGIHAGAGVWGTQLSIDPNQLRPMLWVYGNTIKRDVLFQVQSLERVPIRSSLPDQSPATVPKRATVGTKQPEPTKKGGTLSKCPTCRNTQGEVNRVGLQPSAFFVAECMCHTTTRPSGPEGTVIALRLTDHGLLCDAAAGFAGWHLSHQHCL